MSEALQVEQVSGSLEGDPVGVLRASLHVAEAELVAVLGPSGSGKSSLLAICGGRLTPGQGRVAIAGHDLAGLRGEHRADFLQSHVAWVAQAAAQPQALTSAESLALAAYASGMDDGEAGRTAAMALAATALEGRSRQRADQLSGGEMQRLAVAMALAGAPLLLIADEPTAQLDQRAARSLLELVRQAADSGTAVLLATHDRRVAAVADRVLTMQRGVLAQIAG